MCRRRSADATPSCAAFGGGGGNFVAVFCPAPSERERVSVTTELFASAHRLTAADVLTAVPPACARGVDDATILRDGDEALVQSPAWAPRPGAVQLLPSLSLLTEVPFVFRLEVSACVGGAWTPWAATVTLGDGEFASPAGASSALTVDVDVITSAAPIDAVRVRARLRAAALDAVLAAPRLLTISVSSGEAPLGATAAAGRAALAVPPMSQVAEGGKDALQICSPTSVAMVLGYWGRAVDCVTVAADVFHRGTGRYGIWPAAVQAGARRGVCGYLLRFPTWEAAAWCLARGLPIVASVRYGRGELTEAPLPETTGHLLVLTGYDDGWVLVNDPVAPERASVPRRYRLEQIARVWLTRTGVGYVFFMPSTSPTDRSRRP